MEKKPFDKLNKLRNYVEKAEHLMTDVKRDMQNLQEEYLDNVTERVKQLEIDINFEEFKEFLQRYWLVVEKDEYEYYVIVPDWLKFHVGTFYKREGNYNIFIINKYTRMIEGVPDVLKDEVQLPEPKDYKVVDGVLHFPPEEREEVRDKFGYHAKKVGDRQARIKPGHEFELIASLIREGNLPFVPKPIPEEDLRPHKEGPEKVQFTGKYRFQKDAWEQFREYGAIGLYWMTGAGKDIFSVYALDRVQVDDRPNLYLAPNLTILEQVREEYIPDYAPRLKEELEKDNLILSTYQNYDNIKDEKYGLVIYGECRHLPANTYSRLATLDCKYRIGQTASPFREDGRTDLIFAMTGKPLGLDWKAIMDIMGKTYHEINVHIVPNMKAKYQRLEEIYNPNKETLVYTWRINKGKKIREKLGIPFIYGETKDRIPKLRNNEQVVISKVGELGISLPNLQHVIEFDFLYGSRAGELQKTGRLFHSEEAERHDILFTEKEFHKYKKRLYSLLEKGFSINWMDKKESLEIGDKISKVKFKDLQRKLEETPPMNISSKADFLKHPKVRETIEEIMDESNTYPKAFKGTLATLLQKEWATYDEIAENLGYSTTSNISTAVRELSAHRIVERRKENGQYKVRLNTDGLQDIIKLKQKREQTEEVIESIFGE